MVECHGARLPDLPFTELPRDPATLVRLGCHHALAFPAALPHLLSSLLQLEMDGRFALTFPSG